MVKGRKPVLSNRQLTRQVRTLKGQQGKRSYAGTIVASAVTLTAGTARIDTFGIVENDSACHYVDFRIKLQAAAAATVRLIFALDELYAGTPVIATDFLETATDSASNYADGICLPVREARHKNREFDARVVVYEDRMIPMIASESRIFKVRMKLNGKKFRDKDGNRTPRVSILSLADESNVTMTLANEVYFTEDL